MNVTLAEYTVIFIQYQCMNLSANDYEQPRHTKDNNTFDLLKRDWFLSNHCNETVICHTEDACQTSLVWCGT